MVTMVLFKSQDFELFDQFLHIFSVKKTTKLFCLVDLAQEKLGLSFKLFVGKIWQFSESGRHFVEVWHSIFVQFDEPRFFLPNNSMDF